MVLSCDLFYSGITVNILIASKNTVFRQGLTEIIVRGRANPKVIDSDNLNAVPKIFSEKKVNYCFVDFTVLSGERWIDELFKITNHDRDTGVCLFSTKSHRSRSVPAYKTGVRGVIYNDSDIGSIASALDTVLEGRVYFPDNKLEKTSPQNKRQDNYIDLTFRQKEILHHLYDGCSNKQIGRFLGVSESTVKQHFSKIFKLLSVNNRVEALQKARDLGVI